MTKPINKMKKAEIVEIYAALDFDYQKQKQEILELKQEILVLKSKTGNAVPTAEVAKLQADNKAMATRIAKAETVFLEMKAYCRNLKAALAKK